MKLKIITLTVNNICNMHCQHCYLQLNKRDKTYISNNIINKLLKSNFNHLAIVGQEALFNNKHVKKTENIISKFKKKRITVSLITNGTNLDKLSKKTISNIDYIDISFDGGPKTYSIRRLQDYSKLASSIKSIVKKGLKEINALHTLYNSNINYIDDLMKVNEITKFKHIMFSPYLETKNYGKNIVSKLPIEKILKKLSKSTKFRKAKNAILLIDKYHLEQQNNMKLNNLKALIQKYNLEKKVRLYPMDVLNLGILRVTYDGLVLTPSQSLNPKEYSKGIDLKKTNKSIDKIFLHLVKTQMQKQLSDYSFSKHT